MKIEEIITVLENWAPPILQESYDNSGLLTGSKSWECTGVLTCLDATEDVIKETIAKGCNLIIAHHPILFKGLSSITGKTYVERAIICAIKNDIALYALHTNLDNIHTGVNAEIAKRIGLLNCQLLQPKSLLLKKLFTFVPASHIEAVRNAVFNAGGGHIGNYSECSFTNPGEGSFKPEEGANPFLGTMGQRHTEQEIKLEVVFPNWLEGSIVAALKTAHPYEEVAYDLVQLSNEFQTVGAGMIGNLPEPVSEKTFFELLKIQFGLQVIRHSSLLGKPVQKIAVCGGAGSFLIGNALSAKADVFVTADLKYHEFFDADGQMILADIGHWESEQFTIDLIADFLKTKFPTFAHLKTEVKTNPVGYFC